MCARLLRRGEAVVGDEARLVRVALAAVAEEPIGDLDLMPLGQPAQLAFEGAELLGGQVHLAARVHVAPLDEAAVDAAERPARPVVVGHAGYG